MSVSQETQQVLQTEGVEPWFIDAMKRLARAEERSLDPYLLTVGEATDLDDTRATCRCHFVRVDPQGNTRVPALVGMLADQVVDYCIPRSRIEEAKERLLRTGSTDKILQLQEEARNLFAVVRNSGEGGELLLYTLLEIALGLPQILCKMPLKTNRRNYYNGVDGIHATALEDGKLAVYWGEAKLYADVRAAIKAALNSLAPYLLDDGDGPAQRDMLLLRDHVDPDDPELKAALVRYFVDDTVQASQLVVRGACLVAFSMADYKHPLEENGAAIRAEVADAITAWQELAGAAIANENVAEFDLEIFFVPLPSVEDFREQLLRRMGLRT